MNTENILALADFIEKEEVLFDMGSIAVATCDTAGCIAGSAAALWPGCVEETHRHGITSYDEECVCEKLGLTESQGDDLFYPEGIKYRKVTRATAVAALRHLAATGEIKFDV